jgi:predicted permease
MSGGGDVRQALRFLLRQPLVALAVMTVLGLGLGLSTAVFCLADPFLFRPLPYTRPADLAVLMLRIEQYGTAPGGAERLTLGALEDRTDLFAAVAAYQLAPSLRLVRSSGAVSMRVARVTRRFFSVLGVPSPWPADRWSATQDLLLVALAPAAAARIVGSEVPAGARIPRSGGGTVEIVKVLPPSFVFPSNATLFPIDGLVPLAGVTAELHGDERQLSLVDWTVVARLRKGISPGVVQQALSQPAGSSARVIVEARSLDSYMTRRVRLLAAGALAAALLLYGLCLGNFANLFLARAVHRSSELVTRRALGARLRHLVQALSTEATVVAVGAVVAGLGFAVLALAVSRGATPAQYLALGAPGLSKRAVLATCLMGGLIPIVGLAVALSLCTGIPRAAVASAMAADGRRVRMMRRVMTAAQSAIGILLLLGALLLGRSYLNLVSQPAGVAWDALVATASYPDDHGGPSLQSDIDATLDRIRRVPGVTLAAAARGSLLDRTVFVGGTVVRGVGVPAGTRQVTPDFFSAVGSRVVAGRGLRPQDSATAVVNESFARRYFPNSMAVGATIGGHASLEIVGVASDMFDVALDRPPEPTVFTLLDRPSGCSRDCNRIHYVVRVERGTQDVSPAIARAIGAASRDAATIETTTIGTRLLGSVQERAFAAIVSTLFAATALAVCLAGIASVVAFLASRRTREIAIRLALGAGPTRLITLLAWETLVSVAAGLSAGLVAGHWLLGALTHVLYGLAPGDPWTIVHATIALSAAAATSVVAPAVRALRVSPALALRGE